MAEQRSVPASDSELHEGDDQIPYGWVSADQYKTELPNRLLPYELRTNKEYQLRILWMDGSTRDAVESAVKVQEREITDDGYVIVISQPDLDTADDSEEGTVRELLFSPGGTMVYKYPEGDEEITITDVGYFVRPETK